MALLVSLQAAQGASSCSQSVHSACVRTFEFIDMCLCGGAGVPSIPVVHLFWFCYPIPKPPKAPLKGAGLHKHWEIHYEALCAQMKWRLSAKEESSFSLNSQFLHLKCVCPRSQPTHHQNLLTVYFVLLDISDQSLKPNKNLGKVSSVSPFRNLFAASSSDWYV